MSDVSDQWWSGYASAVVAPKQEVALADRLQRWSAKVSTALAGQRPATADAGQLTTVDAEDWSREFALDPSVAVGHRAKPVPRARPSNITVKARKKIERQLAWLDEEWHVLHVVDQGVDLDHILIGPAGVITLTIACVRNGRVRVTDSRVLVDGQPADHLRHARRDSQRVRQMLSEACGEPVRVLAVVVFVVFDELVVDESPSDVHVTTCRELLPWLKSLPDLFDDSAVESMHDAVLSGATGEHTRR